MAILSSLGELWDAKYLPFWRKWVGEIDAARNLRYSSGYASIDDRAFWQCAAGQFNKECYAMNYTSPNLIELG